MLPNVSDILNVHGDAEPAQPDQQLKNGHKSMGAITSTLRMLPLLRLHQPLFI